MFFAFVLAVGQMVAPRAQAALQFNLVPAPGMNSQAIAGFQAAADRWSGIFSDNMTVNIDINFASLGSGVLGSTFSSTEFMPYADFRADLAADSKSVADATAMAHLPGGSSFGLLINRTADNPNGSGSAIPYVDNDGGENNTTIWMSTANAKAIGALAADDPGSDASIVFSSLFSWDFDPSNGIISGAFDFVGIAAHEIGHSLGFISGVDILDINSPPKNGPFSANQFTYVSPLDMYRFSSLSVANGAIDWTADTRTKYFSIDNGATDLGPFSNGVNFGDGRQASHWKDNLGLGIMDPTAASGEMLSITNLDIRAFDVIGYDLAVPEPATIIVWSLLGLVVAGCGVWRRKRAA